MKVANKPTLWWHEPWTIIKQSSNWKDGGREWFYAYNTLNGDRKPARTTYDKAMQDIPNRYAANWGS